MEQIYSRNSGQQIKLYSKISFYYFVCGYQEDLQTNFSLKLEKTDQERKTNLKKH